MLVLSRYRDESIIIGNNVVVTVVDIRGDKVRLGVEAPREIPVHRKEVYEAIQRENLRASRVEPKNPQDSLKTFVPSGRNDCLTIFEEILANPGMEYSHVKNYKNRNYGGALRN